MEINMFESVPVFVWYILGAGVVGLGYAVWSAQKKKGGSTTGGTGTGGKVKKK